MTTNADSPILSQIQSIQPGTRITVYVSYYFYRAAVVELPYVDGYECAKSGAWSRYLLEPTDKPARVWPVRKYRKRKTHHEWVSGIREVKEWWVGW